MEIQESDMLFSFREDVVAVKYDDGQFYRNLYNVADGTKGVDIIADCNTAMYFIEIKNCEGTAKSRDAWRKRYAGTKNMDTLATEVAQKVAHTCACLAGVSTYGERNKSAVELLDYANALHASNIASLEKKLLVLLYLEGDFSCKTRTNEMIYRDLQKRIKRRLQWLNCRVDVVSTRTRSLKDFKVKQLRQVAEK